MIINEKINSPISIDEKGLQIYIDFEKPDVEKGRGDLRFTAYFQNLVEGVVLDTKQSRIFIEPIQVKAADKFSFKGLENIFKAKNQYLSEYLVEQKFEWIN